jgi:hypothetical protein
LNDLCELAWSPTTEYANAQPRIQVLPLNNRYDGRTAQLRGALYVPSQVAEGARKNLHAMLWKRGSKMRRQERLEVQRRKAAG